jgi:urease accessory protein UreF
LGAGIRLGCLTHIDAQRALIEARQEAACLAELPVPPINELSSYGVEAEIAVMQHINNTMRVFAN